MCIGTHGVKSEHANYNTRISKVIGINVKCKKKLICLYSCDEFDLCN